MKISTKVECGIIAIADIAMNSENGRNSDSIQRGRKTWTFRKIS